MKWLVQVAAVMAYDNPTDVFNLAVSFGENTEVSWADSRLNLGFQVEADRWVDAWASTRDCLVDAPLEILGVSVRRSRTPVSSGGIEGAINV